MSRRSGFTVNRINTGGSKGVVIQRLGRRRRSPSDVGEGRPHISAGITHIRNSKLPTQREIDSQLRRSELQSLPEGSRRAAVQMALETGHTLGIDEQMIVDTDAWEDVPSLDIPISGKEVSVDPSHEGGEYFQLIDMARDSLGSVSHRQYPPRSRQSRLETRRQAWLAQMPTLLNAYMQYKYSDNTVEVPENPTYFHLRVLGINGYESACALPQDQHHEYINQTLLLHGLLGTSPVAPELAIPIPTLELYRRCRLRSPQFSIQQWVKVLCDLSNINYNLSFREQFADGFDTYLEILRRLDHLIKVELGHDQPGWRILHACPACQYKLEGEAELNPSVMGALDGNNSLKRFARGDRGSDTLTFDSDYFLSHEYVDQFANEVKCKVKKVDKETVCLNRWRAAMADNLKGMYNAFTETGVFVSVCRHGFVWTILDMMQSGELAKYPLATVSKLLSVFPLRIGLGYDIACSFTSTLMSSSLASKACTAGLKMVVPAFHGHAHNRLCQLGFHILMSPGFGLEDLETCERIFSSSNAVARLTQHATPFHRRQFIDMFLRQWDAEKYENLGKFLLNNYRQALQVLEEMPVRIKALMSGRQVSEACFATWLQDERDYLESKKTEPDTDVLGVEYVELLNKYNDARTLIANVSAIRKLWEASVKLEANATRANDKARLRQVTHDAWEGMLFLQKGLQDVESQLDVGERWTTDSPAYQQTVELLE
ncbi:hypothetical protein JB92DRAFT_2804438 [Gautieria morchelliformis]|nr:hypothetical protein JB92DRAFT_2804438 [Gautieria morchelliformis]